MEPGLAEGWDDGVCCTGVLVHGSPEAIAGALGRAVAVCDGGRVRRDAVPEGTRGYALLPAGRAWTIVQLADRLVDSGQGDYLAPLFEEASAALSGRVVARAPDELRYETPIALAARLSQALNTRAIALWGSDEWPGLSGGAFVGQGTLKSALSAYSPEVIAWAAASRRLLQEGRGEDDDEGPPMDAGATYRWSPGKGIERVAGRAADLLDEALRAVGAGFDNADLLNDWAEALAAQGEGAEIDDVVALWCAV